MKQYGRFGEDHGERIRGGGRPVPDVHRTVVRVTGGRGARWSRATARTRRRGRPPGPRAGGDEPPLLPAASPPPASRLRDDMLRLLFTFCHPALAIDAQAALALRTLCGLPTRSPRCCSAPRRPWRHDWFG
ncbi:MAG: hypothetical protein ACR2HQ_03825 [Ilumatobacteraceae bacterium]